jgi:mannose/cellobiose epimerase-like protein (N-acyl-D-glucosamine 2-epimerase family)
MRPGDSEFLDLQTRNLIEWAGKSKVNSGGFGWLGLDGKVLGDKNIQSWINSRMLFVFSAATNLGFGDYSSYVEHGINSLETIMHDDINQGWYKEVAGGSPINSNKTCYELAFIILASATAKPTNQQATPVLDEALSLFEKYFWLPEHNMAVDIWNINFSKLDPYRGANANMHMVEALLAAYEATQDFIWLTRAVKITENIFNWSIERHNLLIAEHYDENWKTLKEFNRQNPADPFRPFGICVGHLLEWSRLAIQVSRALGPSAPDWLLTIGKQIYDNGIKIGWAIDGLEGFVYTVDFDGKPVVHDRMHWVVTEAISAAWSWYIETKNQKYLDQYFAFWNHAEQYFINKKNGSWVHQLNRFNVPDTLVWEGSPDVYHAFQATTSPKIEGLISYVKPKFS